MAAALQPDVILMDINMPDMDGITATEQLAAEVPDRRRRDDVGPGRGGLPPPLDARGRPRVPRQAVQLGRADGLHPPGLGREKDKTSRMPCRSSRPAAQIERAQHPASVVAVFSPKGGVGRTTVAVNLAVAAASLGKRVALVDASFQFGDVGVLLNLNPRNKSIADLVGELQADETESLDTFMITHSSGVRVLLGPTHA